MFTGTRESYSMMANKDGEAGDLGTTRRKCKVSAVPSAAAFGVSLVTAFLATPPVDSVLL